MAEPAYADSIIDNVEENGPYIFLAPHICMPHSKAVELVHKPGICFVKVNQPVWYDKNDPDMGAELFYHCSLRVERPLGCGHGISGYF